MTTEYKPLDWNWDELMTLLDSYCASASGSGSSGAASNSTDSNMTTGDNSSTPVVGDGGSGNDTATNTTTASTNSTELIDNWQNLDFPWTDLLANATANSDMTTWDKATY